MMFRRSHVGLAAVVLLAACSDSRDAISPRPTPPALGISDGAHSGGNQDFFFLPPMAKNPSTHPLFDAGRFNGRLRPTVSICRLDAATASTCDLDIKTFAASEISLSDEQYHVNWNTKETPLTLSRMYRISVLVGSEVVGYIDVDPVSNGSQLRAINTNEYIGLVDGRTLPIKFRIEQGATCENRGDCAEETVTNAGGIVLTSSGFAGVDFPANWLPVNPRTGKPYENVVVKIERVAVGIDNRCHSGTQLLQFEGCYEFRTDPDVGPFALPVVAGICPELAPSDPRYSSLSFFTSGEGEETKEAPEADAPFINCEGFTGTPPATIGATGSLSRGLFAFASGVGRFLSPKPLYAIDLGWGGEMLEFSRGGYVLETEIEEFGGNGQTAEPGTSLPDEIAVQVLGHHGRPVRGVGVVFSAGAGSVSATGPVLTNADGVASTTWTLGPTAGSQNAFATIQGIGDGPTVTFTAIAQQVVASVTLQATRIDIGNDQTSAQVLSFQRDAAGNLISQPGPCAWAITSNLGNVQVSQTGVVSSFRPDDGVVTATCGNAVGTAPVEVADFQFTASGSIQDPGNDSGEGAELLGAAASVADRRISFTVTFEINVAMSGLTFASFFVDTDQNVATGHPGISSGGGVDNDRISGDYLVVIENGSGRLLQYAGTLNTWTPVTTNSCTITDNAAVGTRSFTCTYFLSQIGYDQGYINFKAASATRQANGSYSGTQDVVTNVGSPAGTTSPVIQ